MSNFSDFFPGTGASTGTNIITDIKNMQKWVFPDTQLTYYRTGTEFSSNNDNFFTTINGTSQFDARTLKLSATFNTYETLIDLTSAQGYLHWIIFPGNIASNGYTQARITIDGVQTIVRSDSWPIDPYVPSRGRFILGSILPSRAVFEGETNLSAEQQPGTAYDSWGTGNFQRVAFGTDGTSPDFIAITSNYGNSWATLPTLQTSVNLLPKLKFDSSLKIELQANWNTAVNYNGHNYCATYFSLIQ